MIVDAHVHVAHLARLKVPWKTWIGPAGDSDRWAQLYADDGAAIPSEVSRYFAEEGIDRVLLFCEYSPKVTGSQTLEDMLPIVEHDPQRFRIVANVNPHLHHPLVSELDRQLEHGAIALKIHPVHAGIAPNDRELYPLFARCAEQSIPVIIHTGPSSFPGASSRHGDPLLSDDVARDFPDLTIVLAHGGRGGSYDAAAALALNRENVWLDLAGLPPKRLAAYYTSVGLDRIAPWAIFGTDSPAVTPSRSVATIRNLDLSEELTEAILSGNARQVFPGV